MKKIEINMQDEKMKELLSGTKMKAGENLKFRIMHQVEAEQALVRKKKTSNMRPLVSTTITIFGTMYALIGLIALMIYLTAGKSAMETITFFIPAASIASVCGMFWFISVYDERRRIKAKEKK